MFNIFFRCYMLLRLLTIFLVLCVSPIFSKEANESLTQTIFGRIVNFQNQQIISGATIRVANTKLGAVSKSDGTFIIKNVPIGRQIIVANAVGYEPKSYNVILSSGKQFDMNIELLEKIISTDEVVVSVEKAQGIGINESVIVSSTEFSIDDVQKFAGSREDPARMAQNFAGVLGANDTRNDIIIRGGSPIELLWRLDGMEIPNPNHFATQGATGGPVSAINTNLLDNSDFITGAFPAEYYDKMSGVFDLRTKRGNPNRYENTFQFGFNGFELGTEGPIAKNASFAASYRYSFLDFLEKMGVDFGFSGIPKYQDLMLKFNWDINDKHRLTLTSLLGTSDIAIRNSKLDSAYTGDFDIDNGTDLLSIGLNYKYLISENLFLEAIIGTNYSKYRTSLDSITTNNNNIVTDKTLWFTSNNLESFQTAKFKLNYIMGKGSYLNIGTELKNRQFDFDESRMTTNWDETTPYSLVKTGNTLQSSSFINWNYRPIDDLTVNAGITSQYLQISNKTTFEPRLSFSYRLDQAQSIKLGFGIHGQSVPLLINYQFVENNELDFMQSIHYILGYSYNLNESLIFKFETYYKDLSKIPVDMDPSTYSFVNSGNNFGSVFSSDPLVSKGIGRTYGAELSFIKQFTDGYYITATGSLVRQDYKGSDDKWRFGAFDNKFIFNLLAGYDWQINETFVIEMSAKYTLAGGAPYTPIDVEKSKRLKGTYYLDSEAYSLRNENYNRFDIKINFRQNFDNFAIISYVSVENLLNNENILMYIWDVKNEKIKRVNQLGVFPIGGFKIEF